MTISKENEIHEQGDGNYQGDSCFEHKTWWLFNKLMYLGKCKCLGPQNTITLCLTVRSIQLIGNGFIFVVIIITVTHECWKEPLSHFHKSARCAKTALHMVCGSWELYSK